jgi:hypothetical protein
LQLVRVQVLLNLNNSQYTLNWIHVAGCVRDLIALTANNHTVDLLRQFTRCTPDLPVSDSQIESIKNTAVQNFLRESLIHVTDQTSVTELGRISIEGLTLL